MDLTLLPTEILEKIFSYLNTRDVINLRSVYYRFVDISTSYYVIRNVNLSGYYDLDKDHLANYFGKYPTCSNITCFNVANAYWISAADLRKAISKLVNLKSLYVIDTKLGVTKPDVTLYRSLPKLERLGVTILRRTLCKEAIQLFPPLTHMFFHIESRATSVLQLLLEFLKKNVALRELWIIEIGLPMICDWSMIMIPKNVPVVTTLAINFACVRDSLIHNNLSKMFMSSVRDQFAVYKKIDVKKPLLYEREYRDPNWAYLLRLRRCSSPFPPKLFEEIYNDDSKLETTDFGELNVVHHDPRCSDAYMEHTRNLLLYENTKNMRKLAFNMCAGLIDKEFSIAQPTKRPKKEELEQFPTDCLLSKIVQHSPNIEELEMWPCHRTTHTLHISDGTVEHLAGLKNLVKLTLDDVPHFITGSFLLKVLFDCTKLESLRIRCREQNVKLHNALCNALPHAINLKDLRYEHQGNISTDRLFESLSTEKVRLNRLYVKCRSVEIFSAKPLEIFMQNNPQLLFLCIVIADLPGAAIKAIRNAIKRFKDGPRKIYVLAKVEELCDNSVHIPHIHFHDMVKLSSRISMIDIFNDFHK